MSEKTETEMETEPKDETPKTFDDVAKPSIKCVTQLVRNLKLRKHLDRTNPELLEAFDDAFDEYGDWLAEQGQSR